VRGYSEYKSIRKRQADGYYCGELEVPSFKPQAVEQHVAVVIVGMNVVDHELSHDRPVKQSGIP
jgi:hypothetical protein